MSNSSHIPKILSMIYKYLNSLFHKGKHIGAGLASRERAGTVLSFVGAGAWSSSRCFSELRLIVKVSSILRLMARSFILVTVLRFYFCFLFGVRSLFVEESPWAFPIIASIVEVIHYSSLTNMPHQALYLLVGVYLIAYDNLGAFFSQVFEDDSALAVTYLVIPIINEPLKRFVGFKTFFIGKSALSSTGRASIAVGATVLTGTFLISHFDRAAANARAAADRAAADARAATDRAAADTCAATDRAAADARAATDRAAADACAAADRHAQYVQQAQARGYRNYKDAREDYKKTPFYKTKGEKPTWDESNWEKWSKTK